jgi:hypothetical protein
MADQSNRGGIKSGGQIAENTRYGENPAPENAPVAGAYGRRGGTAGDIGSEETAPRSEKAEREKVDQDDGTEPPKA